MLAANPSDIRRNLKDYVDKVVDNDEPLIITRPGGRDVVTLSKEEMTILLKILTSLEIKRTVNGSCSERSKLRLAI